MTNSETRIYSDIDLNFNDHPLTGDISKKINEDSIIQALKTLIQLEPYDKPFQSNITSEIRNTLFENLQGSTALTLEELIRNVILNYEPRVKILNISVKVNSASDGYDVYLRFNVLNRIEPYETTLFLQRVR